MKYIVCNDAKRLIELLINRPIPNYTVVNKSLASFPIFNGDKRVGEICLKAVSTNRVKLIINLFTPNNQMVVDKAIKRLLAEARVIDKTVKLES
ncbi:MAG: hypothetical protein QXQ33_00785 [Nitrososphaerota archaeon]